MSAATGRPLAERVAGPGTVAAFFAGMGVLHLVAPKPFERVMPPQLPAHRELVLASGVAEIAGGALFAHPRTRRFGARYLVLLLWAVYPANVNMALQPEIRRVVPGGAVTLVARLPLQFVMMWWVRRLAARTATSPNCTA